MSARASLAQLGPDAKVVRGYFADGWRSVPDTLSRAVTYYSSLTAERAEAAYQELLAAGRIEERHLGPILAPSEARYAQTPARQAARAAVKAWNDRHDRRNVIVTVVTADPDGEESIDIVFGEAFVNADDVAVIRSQSTYRDRHLATLAVHALNATIGTGSDIEPADLDFPPPDCTRCDVSLNHDGDRFVCRYCGAHWSSNGADGSFPCVECHDHDASITGADGQPRCRLCEAKVRANLIDPTEPYECRDCKAKVYGIGPGSNSPTRQNRRCGSCQASRDRDAYLDEILGRRAAKAGASC